jgi:(1->4)-alpha-D-glucan 1-alpha-D-glucosylmutase
VIDTPLQANRPHPIPNATYRVQFNKTFTFAQARELVDYLADLGISHIYASPFFKAREGSMHGYDVVDHGALNPEVGTKEELAALTDALKQRAMGQIADFVPNHMGISQADNPWWLDILEYGEGSPYAEFFDIDFRPAKAELRGKVLLPVLDSPYGRVLENGQLRLKLDAEGGRFSIWYWDHRFPVTPYRYGDIFSFFLPTLRKTELSDQTIETLEGLQAGFRDLRRAVRSGRARFLRRQKAAKLKEQFAALLGQDSALAEGIQVALEPFHGTMGDPPSFLRLHRLLEGQYYRLASWRTASDEINYRRFFQINELAGLRVEVPAVFDAAHRLVLELLAEGHIQGIRIDHIDGLFDPKGYLDRLREKGRAALSNGRDPYVLVEKILGPDESLRAEWPCAGTTGYEALNEINGLFVDPASEDHLTRAYVRFTGERVDFDAIVRDCKRQVMRAELASEVEVLVNGLYQLSERDWRTRDYTMRNIRMALEEIIACFPVYRTYIDRRNPTSEDLKDIDQAVALARKNPQFSEEGVFDYLWGILSADSGRRKGDPFPRVEVQRLARKAQQVTSPVMAKGVEDTAFYRFNRLVSLNEVGGHPDVFGITPTQFHLRMIDRARSWPHTMLSTATHDTKRGEDLRARINVLTEREKDWSERVRRWAKVNHPHKPEVDGQFVPSANDEYLFYQTLVGVWPTGLTVPRDGAEADTLVELDVLRDRLKNYMLKVVREAKVHSAWTRQNEGYEQGMLGWIERVLDGCSHNAFLDDFQDFQVGVARVGVVNSLAQVVLKYTCPGVPDLYQGCELWDLSLVDPDNRRPVDFDIRRAHLSDLMGAIPDSEAFGALARGLLEDWRDSRVKLFVTWRLLQFRHDHPDLFRCGTYRPLSVEGSLAKNVIAFERQSDGGSLVVVVPRLVNRLMPTDGDWPVGEVWDGTSVLLETSRVYRDVLTNRRTTLGKALNVANLLEDFPMAVLVEDRVSPSL